MSHLIDLERPDLRHVLSDLIYWPILLHARMRFLDPNTLYCALGVDLTNTCGLFDHFGD